MKINYTYGGQQKYMLFMCIHVMYGEFYAYLHNIGWFDEQTNVGDFSTS